MDDFDSEETSEEVTEAQAPTVDVAKLQKALEKANREALEARLELRRTQLEKDYGEELVALIPQSLPQGEWKDYAEKLKLFRSQSSIGTQTDQAPEAGSQEEPSPEEKALAAVAKGPSAASGAPGKVLSLAEIAEAVKRDPSQAARIYQAQVDPETGLLRTS